MGFRPKCPHLNNPLRGESARIEAVIIEQQSAKLTCLKIKAVVPDIAVIICWVVVGREVDLVLDCQVERQPDQRVERQVFKVEILDCFELD